MSPPQLCCPLLPPARAANGAAGVGGMAWGAGHRLCRQRCRCTRALVGLLVSPRVQGRASSPQSGAGDGLWHEVNQRGCSERLHGAEPALGAAGAERRQEAEPAPLGLLAPLGPPHTGISPTDQQPSAVGLGSRAGFSPGTGARWKMGLGDKQPRAVRRGRGTGITAGGNGGRLTVAGHDESLTPWESEECGGQNHLVLDPPHGAEAREGQGGHGPDTPQDTLPQDGTGESWGTCPQPGTAPPQRAAFCHHLHPPPSAEPWPASGSPQSSYRSQGPV